MVFFGGFTNGASTGTWELGTAWTQTMPTTPPPATYGSAEAWDAVSGLVVVVGGLDSTPYAGAWAYDGLSWTALATNPGAHSHGNMVFDVSRGKLIFFGGFGSSTSVFSAETWEY